MLSHSKRSFLAKPFPTFLILGGLFFFAILLKQNLFQDGDTGVHIRAGQYMMETRSFIREDLFSFYTPTVHWNNHEWLAEIIMAVLFGWGGFKLIAIFYSLLIAGTLTLLFKQIENKSNEKVLILLSLFIYLNLSIHFHARPHIFTLLFIALLQKLADDFQRGKKNRLWFVPILMLFWVNLHGGFVVGIFLLGIYGVGNFLLGLRAEIPEKFIYQKRCKTFFSTIAVCVGVTLLNPDGFYLWKYVLSLTSNRVLMDHISEFVSVDFHTHPPFLHIIYLTFIILAASRFPLSLIEWMLISFFGYMAFYSVRHGTLLTVIATPILARQLLEIFRTLNLKLPKMKLSNMRENSVASTRIIQAINLIFLFIFFLGFAKALNPARIYAFDGRQKPEYAVQFIEKENLPERMLSDDEFGDYLIFRLWPERKVFCYGFNDKDGLARFKDYFEVLYVKENWEYILAKHQIQWIMPNTKSTLTNVLISHPDWKLIYSDRLASIFMRNQPENQSWLNRFQNVSLVKEEPAEEKKGISHRIAGFFVRK